MSVRDIQGSVGYRSLGGGTTADKTLASIGPALGPWVRNPSWPTVATPGSNEVLALYAAFNETGAPDFLALNCTVSSGSYRVELGDGTDTNIASGTQFNHTINYAALPDIGLSYRICTVRLTPVTGGATFAAVELRPRHSSLTVNNPISGWLEVKANTQSASSFPISANLSGTTRAPFLENVELHVLNAANILTQGARGLRRFAITYYTNTSFNANGVLLQCRVLTDVSIAFAGTGRFTSATSFFSGCSSLESVPLFDTSQITDMSNMFDGCTQLSKVPLFNTAATSSMSYAFANCTSLVTVPLFNTASVTNMSGLFNNCTSLVTVPLFNTASVTNMSQMFSGCQSLLSVPLFNTASVTNMSQMFQNCTSLVTVPLFNTASVTNMSQMFSANYSLVSVPSFNTASVTNMNSMFNVCYSLKEVPLLNTAAVTTMSAMFSNNWSLRVIPALNLGGVTAASGFNNIFASCVLQRNQATGARFTHTIANNSLSSTALDEYYTGLATITGQTLTVTGNYGTAGDTPTIATAKGWTVTGS